MTDVREYFKRWPRFYYFVAVVFGPVLDTGLTTRGFLRKYFSKGTILNLGSGPRIIASEVVNVDIHPYAGVSVVADICAVPLADGSAARIVSDNVLEHVRNPQDAVREMHRLLESGGYAYISTPFLYAFHSSPSDFQRWTVEGYRALFKEFEIVELGTRAGPFSALCTWACHTVGFLFSFGSPTLNSLFTNLSMFVLFPLKLPDIIFGRLPNSHMVAAVLYCVVRKP
jgi:SAM-dependent methyltransferase